MWCVSAALCDVALGARIFSDARILMKIAFLGRSMLTDPVYDRRTPAIVGIVHSRFTKQSFILECILALHLSPVF